MRIFFTESLCKERSSGKPMKCDFSFIKTKLTQNILFACVCEFFKDCCLVYFCTTYYKISQFVSSIYHSSDIFEVCFIASLASSLRFTHGFVDKQNLIRVTVLRSARRLFRKTVRLDHRKK